VFDSGRQVYWTEQVEMQILAAQAWVAQAQGSRREAHKLMRAAADLEDASAKTTVLESRLYPMRELLADLLREQGDPGAALTEYDAVAEGIARTGCAPTTAPPSRPRRSASARRRRPTSRSCRKLTQDASSDRPELAN
jgi:hypothetical protein